TFCPYQDKSMTANFVRRNFKPTLQFFTPHPQGQNFISGCFKSPSWRPVPRNGISPPSPEDLQMLNDCILIFND
ncbi:MAG: hypothetical protein LBR51_02500, partial [Bacteroidales bacterium]|nr:hypothetical protein [Bacteroidales bacterium]